ncbi:tRNA 2-thiouridine synthesizing protein A OS=Castellaniella defragrans OX=75697 GN=HNR28_000389 PE=3 SV=1 [Castellaniella defragrans]
MTGAEAPGLPQADEQIDARGLNCPLPILRTKKALAKLASGQVLAVLTTDPHAAADFQAFCHQTGNALLAQCAQDGAAMMHYVRRR